MSLVLERKVGEGVRITPPDGEALIIKILRVKGKKVRLAFIGPHDVRIVRVELAEIDEANRAASHGGPP